MANDVQFSMSSAPSADGSGQYDTSVGAQADLPWLKDAANATLTDLGVTGAVNSAFTNVIDPLAKSVIDPVMSSITDLLGVGGWGQNSKATEYIDRTTGKTYPSLDALYIDRGTAQYTAQGYPDNLAKALAVLEYKPDLLPASLKTQLDAFSKQSGVTSYAYGNQDYGTNYGGLLKQMYDTQVGTPALTSTRNERLNFFLSNPEMTPTQAYQAYVSEGNPITSAQKDLLQAAQAKYVEANPVSQSQQVANTQAEMALNQQAGKSGWDGLTGTAQDWIAAHPASQPPAVTDTTPTNVAPVEPTWTGPATPVPQTMASADTTQPAVSAASQSQQATQQASAGSASTALPTPTAMASVANPTSISTPVAEPTGVSQAPSISPVADAPTAYSAQPAAGGTIATPGTTGPSAMINPATGQEDPTYTGSTPMSMSSMFTPSTIGSVASGVVNAGVINSANDALQKGLAGAEGTVAGYAKPFVDTGVAANQQLATGLQTGGQFNTPFTMENAANSAAMKTALAQGSSAIQNSAAAKGGLLGTNTLAGLSDYGQQTGAQYENQAFNQDLATKQLAMGGLENLSGTGASTSQNAGSNIANLQASGAQAGMNATLGELNQLNSGVQNAITAGTANQPTAVQQAAAKAAQAAAAAAAAKAAGGTQAATPNTGTMTGAPAGSIIDPATGQAATTTPGQVANGTVTPTQTVDPAQAAQINAQNGTPASAPGTAPASQPVEQLNQQLASQLNVPVSNSVGSTIGDYSPFNGALIVPDSATGLPVNGMTGLPEMPADSFTSWMDQLMTPTSTGNMGAGILDPLSEFLSTPASSLGGAGAGMDLSAINDIGYAPAPAPEVPTYTMDSMPWLDQLTP